MKTTQNTASNHSTSGRTSRLARNLFCSLAIAAGFVSSAQAVDLTPTIVANRGDGKTVAKFLTTGTGTWTIPAGVTEVEVLVVGGGGGNDVWSGGAGAGGMYFNAAYSVTAGASMTVTVGTGGVGLNYDKAGIANSGELSQFGTQLIAYGGSGGADYSTAAGGNQGGYSADGGGTVVPGQAPVEPRAWGWWSGSGAGAPGTQGGAGGSGAPCSITGSEVYYAGGGGVNENGVGGLGGGGHGSYAFGGVADPGSPNTGGGAGGSWGGNPGAAGGSGVVMVAYTSTTTFYTVSFNSNEGSTVSDQSVESGSTASVPTPAPTKTGFTFVEWCTDSGLGTAFNFSTPITGATTLYAKWVTNWVVTFDSTGGSAVSPQYVYPGATATLPAAPTKTGYTFDGWYGEIGLLNLFDFGTAITADTTIYAKWAINSYTLTYSAGTNGSLVGGSPQTQNVNYGGNGTAVTAQPDTGYQFASWSDGKLTNPRTDLNVGANITVTANFELIPPPIVPDSTVLRGDGKTVATFSTVGHGPWTIPTGVTEVEVLVVGGGGGGGFWTGGGGGGGLYASSAYAVTAGTPVTVTVGVGGAKNENYQAAASPGTESVFGSLTANGGMGGTSAAGGASGTNNQGGTGFAGGTDTGAGGGAGEAGDNGWYAAPNNNGGYGVASAITGTSTYYAGGGSALYNGALGGLGGGGSTMDDNLGGIANPNGLDGLGGGGAAARNAGTEAGKGGSGVVIVAYLAATGSATTTDLVSSLPTSYLNDSVTFTATVKVGGEVVPSLPGTVEFKVDGVVKAASASIDSVTGVATYTTTELAVGTYDVVATYSGVTGTYMTSSDTISQTVSNTPFADWANTNITAKQPGADATPTGDPDGDGSNNLSEYAFAGDPLSGTDNPKVLSEVKTVDGRAGNELVLTVAVLDVPGDFVAAGDELSLTASSASGGITYTIEGSDNLVFPGAAVTEVSAPLTLDPLPDGYAYRSFVLTDGGLVGKGFLRAKAVK